MRPNNRTMVIYRPLRFLTARLTLAFVLSSCTNDPPSTDLCDGVTCSSRGSCVTDGVSPYCACDDGFHPKGLGCVENDETDPCLEVACNDHGTCEITPESLPRCLCDAPFENLGAPTLCLNISGSPIDDAGVDAPDTDVDESACEVGTTQACVCIGGDEGTQTCQGDRWGVCVCEEPPCEFGEIQDCSCPDGSMSLQTCVGETWLDCLCDDSILCDSGDRRDCTCSDEAIGEQVCEFSEWVPCVCAGVGDVCTSQTNCISDDVDLLCVLQQVGDTYGICTLPCDDWTDCIPIDDFYSCCDIVGAGAACLPDGWECDDV